MPERTEDIVRNVAGVRQRIAAAAARAGRSSADITLIAITKNFPAEDTRAAHAAGVRHFGENRVQERESKQPALADLDGFWHLVGNLQANKVRRALHCFDCVDSVDSVALARRLDRAMDEVLSEPQSSGKAIGTRLPILLEVRLAEEATKGGASEEELPGLAEVVTALPHLELRGLMCIPPYAENPNDSRSYFRRLAALREELIQRFGVALPALSMGMSHDFEVAIEEGATEVRVGTDIFGQRTAP